MTRPEKTALGCFLAWCLAGLVLTPLQLTSDTIADWQIPPELKWFIGFCLKVGDPFLMVLAAISTHAAAIRLWGANRARRWGLIVIVVGTLVETVGCLTGYPFGAYSYTSNFGSRIAGVLPWTIPLAWFVIVTNTVLLARFFPGLKRWQESVLAATLAMGIDWVMEPFAVRVKGYWLWDKPGIPVQNYLSWWVIVFVVAQLAAPSSTELRMERDSRPLWILGGFLLLFVEGRLYFGV